MLFISCTKEAKRAEKITISGTVTASSNFLDSVEVELCERCFMCIAIPVEVKQSKAGVFKFEFKPKTKAEGGYDYYYSLDFRKKGYFDTRWIIDKTKEIQECDIVMVKKTD